MDLFFCFQLHDLNSWLLLAMYIFSMDSQYSNLPRFGQIHQPWDMTPVVPSNHGIRVSVDNKVCKCIYFGSALIGGNSRGLKRFIDPLFISPLYIALRTTLLANNLGNFTVDPPNGFPPLFGSREGFWNPPET